MVPIEGTQKEIPVDLVLIAAGFLGSEGYVAESFGVKLNARTNVETVNGSYRTGKRRFSLREICTEVSHWSYGRLPKAGKPQRKWTSR